MRHRSKVLIKNNWITLSRRANPITNRISYVIQIDLWKMNDVTAENRLNVREHFDPNKNKGSDTSTKWSYRNKDEALQLVTMALLKWG